MNTPRLHPDTIEEVKSQIDIVDVVGEHVVLKKRGKDYQGLCPFHQEKSPSFSVSPTKQMYYCFGCQVGGNAITFLMELGKQSFTDVVLDLARKYQISVRTLEPEQRQELQRQLSQREQLYEILAIASNFYQHALHQSQGEQALKYLQIDRGLNDETIQSFQLGYAPSGWETLAKYLVESKKLPIKLVAAAGLIIPRKDGNGYYDRFRDRAIVPIRDLQGRVIGFGGRCLGDEQPKYLNSPETELFDKGKTLFGLDRAKDAIIKTDRAVVVEGYFDAIALHRAGINNAVASLGTALSLNQVKQLVKFSDSKQIILNFDADKAGNIAAERAIGAIADLAYQGQVQLRVLKLPAGKDADEFLKTNSPESYRTLLDNAPLWVDWQMHTAIADRDLTQAEQYQQATRQIIKLLDRIKDSTNRTHYLQKGANLLSGGDARMVPLLVENLRTGLKSIEVEHKYQPPSKSNYDRPHHPVNNPSPLPEYDPEEYDDPVSDPVTNTIAPLNIHPHQRLIEQAEALLLRIYLHYPGYRLEIIDALDSAKLELTLSHHRFIWNKIISSSQTGDIDYHDDKLISKLQDLAINHPREIAQINHLFHLDERTAQEIQRSPLVIRAAIACLEKVACEQQRKHYLDKLQHSDRDNPQQRQEYYQLFYAAQKRLTELEQQRIFTIFDLISV
jgi:DNA primase